ncbi:MAG: TonB family protein [Paludibacteraceae bacterium]|nr:TonB family protein [Candidatus Physcocola equi]MCQ2234115.1 TonB family protein [Paludibacteraceae bacterium]
MQLEEKSKWFGGVASFLFHVAVLLILLFVYMRNETPVQEEDGVPVSMGMPDQGGPDFFEPTPASEVPEVAEAQPQSSELAASQAPDLPTQEIEETVTVPTSKEKKKEQEKIDQELLAQQKAQKEAERLRKEEELRKKEEARKKAEEEEAARQRAQNATNIFKKKTDANGGGADANSKGTGNGANPGNQGAPDGKSGGGLGGNGNRFDLAGRTIVGSLPRPAYTVNEQGSVIVNVEVNSEGTVVAATVQRCKGITSKVLKDAAVAAAYKAKFNYKKGPNQKGTITYEFKLN